MTVVTESTALTEVQQSSPATIAMVIPRRSGRINGMCDIQ
jgi:hypothetical protein